MSQTQPDKLYSVEEVETIARNAIYAASQKEDWRELGLNIERVARQLADTMRENDFLKSQLEAAAEEEMRLTKALSNKKSSHD